MKERESWLLGNDENEDKNMILDSRFKQTEIGKIPVDWDVKELKEILSNKGYIRGPFGSALRRPELKTEGIPVYEQQNAIYNHRNFRYFIDEEKLKKLSRFIVKENDLIISCSGTLGRVSIISKDDPVGIISQALLILRPNISMVHPQFLFYFFYSQKGYSSLISRSSGSVQVNLAKREVIEKIILPLPPFHEQRLIASFLRTLDNKIELNRQMNTTLEAIGQALFKHWFVDFEFPNEEGKPYKSSGGEMEETDLGVVPVGWNVSAIGKELKIVLGGTPDRTNEIYWKNGIIPWINSGKVNEFRIIEPTEYITKEGLDNSATKLLPKRTTVLAITGATLGQVSLLEIESCANQSVIGVLESDTIPSEYIFYWIKHTIDEIISWQTGGAQQHINKNNVDNSFLLIPDNKILNKYLEIISPVFDKISQNSYEAFNLVKIRDTILPKLMSGEIRVNHN